MDGGNELAKIELVESSVTDRLRAAQKEIERLRSQLAECSIIAKGGVDDDQVAKKGDYTWSPEYEDVLKLRRIIDRVEAQAKIRWGGK